MSLELPKKGQFWQHYKGNLYEIIGLGFHIDTNDAIVVYRRAITDSQQCEGPLFARPLSMFLSTTSDHEPRFSKKYEASRQ